MIVSHKTENGHYDPERVNLRRAALDWMTAQGLIRELGLSTENVYFESTRAEKLRRIAALPARTSSTTWRRCWRDPAFPPGVTRICFHRSPAAGGALRRLRHLGCHRGADF